MEKDINFSPLRLAILGLVAMQPQSGYDLRKTFASTPMGNFSSSPGAIYPALKSLEKKGLIRGEADNETSLRPRLVYSTTVDGEAALKLELEKTVTHKDLIWHYDLLMLRFAFMEKLGQFEAVRFLSELSTELADYIHQLEELMEQTRAQLTVCSRLAFEQGIEGYRGNLRWARRALRGLSQQKQNGGFDHDN